MNSTGVYYAIVKKLESLFQNYVQVFKHNIFTFIIIFKVDYNKINFMSLKSLLNFFQPQDKIFYSLFEQVTTTLAQMGVTFHEAIHETDYQKRVSLLKSLEDLEHKNDEVTHQIFIELGRNFITPFDREDIHYLATSLDDVADYIQSHVDRRDYIGALNAIKDHSTEIQLARGQGMNLERRWKMIPNPDLDPFHG
jgi:hypothetical protein